MAEFVEYRKERTLPEYEQMQILNLFSADEILKIKRARENFEYRTTQPSRDIKDFVEYIKYERNLIALTKKRTKDRKPSGTHNICSLIASRMKQLYAQALSKFPHNLRFWDEYIKFLQQFKFNKDVSATFDRMLQFHSDKPDVWTRVILCEYNENASDERVKGLMLRAQQMHPESLKLYLTFFQIELENKRQADEELALQHATIVYNNGKKRFPTNFNFYLEMLTMVDKFNYAHSIQTAILNDMSETFKNDDILWHTFAQRELIGLTTGKFLDSIRGGGGGGGGDGDGDGDDEAEDVGEDDDDHHMNGLDDIRMNLEIVKSEEQVQPYLRKRIEICVQIYEEAVKVVNTAKMWNYYLDAMIGLNKDLSSLSSLKRYALCRAFEAANRSNKMSEKHYLQYTELLYSKNQKDENVERVLQKASKMHPKSLDIWFQFIRYHIRENNFKRLKEIFKTAKERLGSTGAEVWFLYLMYLRTQQSTEANTEFERLMIEVAAQPHATFSKLKAQLLEHIAVSISIKRARKMYNLFIKHSPSCYEVHEMMAELEAKQLRRDVDAERQCLEMMTFNFGKVRLDVWLRYMRFERNVGDPKNVGQLYANALKRLNKDLLDDFIAQYHFFNSGTICK